MKCIVDRVKVYVNGIKLLVSKLFGNIRLIVGKIAFAEEFHYQAYESYSSLMTCKISISNTGILEMFILCEFSPDSDPKKFEIARNLRKI